MNPVTSAVPQIVCLVLCLLAGGLLQAEARSPADVQQSGVIYIGIRDKIPPVQYKNAQGEWTGIDGDLGTMLAKTLGVTPIWRELTKPSQREEVLLQKDVDVVISSFSVTEGRLKVLNFSNPYLTTGLALMILQKEKHKTKSYKDLVGKTIVATQGSTGAESLSKLIPQAHALLVPSVPETYKALQDGKADALLNDEIFLRYYAAQHPEFLVLPGLLSVDTYGIGLHKDDQELLEAVNMFLDTIKQQGELQALLKKHLPEGAHSQQAPPGVASEPSVPDEYDSYTVKAGDTLSRIALQYYANPTEWPRIYEANKEQLRFASVVQIGQKLKIPKLVSARQGPPSTVAPLPKQDACTGDIRARLRELKALYQSGLIQREVYQRRQHELLQCQ